MCVFVYVYVVGWLGWSTCLQGGAVVITTSGDREGRGTFTNCNFTLNKATGTADVSLEEEHVDDCEMSKCMMMRLCPPCISS